ncbi:MAG: molybdopterin converting factor subunit 1 [Chloroflexota bacterium]|nr:molybdopterin converting factor subunit 1 [Chloroflexota bacterium]MDE2941083.1 molybdopterin converting factor subunit 1 [Chloroflexota bacterium]MDE3267391.1 molybdopterin converting factor subunit 1 [Chloroflexota bacterium]
MRVAVRFFAMYRERAGVSHTEVELPEGSSPAQLLVHLRSEFPSLPAEAPVLIAVNSEYVSDEAVLQDGDEVAFIPPVSGGER